jgi:hypothetical protein
VPVAHACNSTYLGGWDQENHDSRSAQAHSPQDPLSKITRAEWTGGVAQEVECLFCMCRTLSSNPGTTKKSLNSFNNNNNNGTWVHKEAWGMGRRKGEVGWVLEADDSKWNLSYTVWKRRGGLRAWTRGNEPCSEYTNTSVELSQWSSLVWKFLKNKRLENNELRIYLWSEKKNRINPNNKKE